jgi:hypothetical protein
LSLFLLLIEAILHGSNQRRFRALIRANKPGTDSVVYNCLEILSGNARLRAIAVAVIDPDDTA